MLSKDIFEGVDLVVVGERFGVVQLGMELVKGWCSGGCGGLGVAGVLVVLYGRS